MPSYVIDSGRLARAAIGHRRRADDQVYQAVRDQAIALVDQELFEVCTDGAQPPLLTAMDRDGRVSAIAVVPQLQGPALIDLLARAGRAGRRSWLATAELYPRGVAAFRRDWNGFRESAPADRDPAPRLTVFAGAVCEQVADAAHLLADVRIVGLHTRTTDGGQVLLEVDGTAPVPRITARQGPREVRMVLDQAAVHLEEDLARTRPRTVQDPAASAADSAPAQACRQPVADSAPAQVGRQRVADSAPTPSSSATDDTRSASGDLRAVAGLVDAPVGIELQVGRRTQQRATLRADGTLVLADGRAYTDLDRCTRELLNGQYQDPWQAWRFTEGGLPLAEALIEARLVRRRGPVRRSVRTGVHRGRGR